jgi:hypothetical protein
VGTSPLADPSRTPPLGGKICPDPRWNGGRALVLQGPNAFLGARWVFTASLAGQPASPAHPEPPAPTPAAQGGLPFVDWVTGLPYETPESPDQPEGSTAYADEVEEPEA